MQNPMHKLIEPFPFENLPELTSRDLKLQKRLQKIYGFVSNQSDLINEAVAVLRAKTRLPLEFEFMHAEVFKRDELLPVLPENITTALVRVGFLPQPCLISFETRFMQILVDALLGGAASDLAQTKRAFSEPLTPLAEGLAKYIVVSLLDKISQRAGGDSLAFEGFVKDIPRLQSLYDKRVEFGVLTLRVQGVESNMFIKLALPLSESPLWNQIVEDDKSYGERRQDFAGFAIPVHLELGRVTLSTEDLAALESGDIIFLDESGLVNARAGQWQGEGWVRFGAEPNSSGLKVDLKTQNDKVTAQWQGQWLANEEEIYE